MSAYATPLVRQLAAQCGVNLEAVRGTGAGGRIRKDDVLAAAGVRTPPTAPATVGRIAKAANPLVARALESGTPGTGPTPTLFESGDLPPFCASGIDPQLLLQVPAAARHPMARASTAAEAYGFLQAYSVPGGEVAAANDFRYDDGNLDYEHRVAVWAGTTSIPTEGSLTDDTNPWMPSPQSIAAAAAARDATAKASNDPTTGDQGWFPGAATPHSAGRG